jgi:hypothetical protein
MEKKTFAAYILFFYLATNFYVNLCDFIYKTMLESGAIRGYYHDEFFLSSFSYKVHQFVLCVMFSFASSELLSPDLIKQTPQMIGFTFKFTIPVSFSMILTFLLELTWYSPAKRLSVFKTEIAKLLLTVIFLNLFMLINTTWLWSLGKTIQNDLKSREQQVLVQRKQYEEYIKRLRRNRPNAPDSDIPKLQLKLPVNESVKTVQDFELKGIGN